ncbi:DUF1353 domain-containing protein [Oerskovia gallyi]|uniref:DUF1353 domain-containing protein n=1 Tax=Oerskovia gallyi TaxID=2762226 RepID=A0ABR8UWS0_9CELL|nr:DUF1353 domain-containing protein [Oerskovia gallyi]MBD7996998.1 DUF1353 domain-containing protein [Oerskovia gallyi]
MPFVAPLPGDRDRWGPAATVDLRQLPVSGRWKVWFEVLTPFGYTSRPADEQSRTGPVWRRASIEQTVPAGLVTDLASVPMPLWGVIASYGRQTLPAILHDATSRALADSDVPPSGRRAARRDADRLFRETLRETGTGPVRRWLMWAAVRIFGSLPVAVVFLLAVVAGLVALGLVVAGALTGGTAGPWLVGALVVTAVALVVLLAQATWAGVESRQGRAERWVPAAVGSMLGAVGTGLVALPLLLPLIVLTFVTELVVGLGEGGRAGVRAQDAPAGGRRIDETPTVRITYPSGEPGARERG